MHGLITLASLNQQAEEAAEILSRHGMTLLFAPGNAPGADVTPPQDKEFGRPDARYIFHGEHLWVLPLTTTGRGVCAALCSRHAVRQGQWYVISEVYAQGVWHDLLAADLTLTN